MNDIRNPSRVCQWKEVQAKAKLLPQFVKPDLYISTTPSASCRCCSQWHKPRHTRVVDFGAVPPYNNLIEVEMQFSGVKTCCLHGKGFCRQENIVSFWPSNALVIGFRVHSYWDNGTNEDFFICAGGILQDHVNIKFRTQEHRGGHWAVEAWYLDGNVFPPQADMT